MEITYIKTKADQIKFIKFIDKVYKENRNYHNSNAYMIKRLFSGKSSFCKDKVLIPIMVTDQNQVVAECILIYTKYLSEILQIAFFEALPNCKSAVDLIISTAKKYCAEHDLHKVSIGLNGHVNYGFGLLLDHYEDYITFGGQYNPPYYIDYWESYPVTKTTLLSFKWDMSLPNLAKYRKLCDRIDNNYTYRTISAKNLRQDARIYTDFNNVCFKGHTLHYDRTYEEDYDMLHELLDFYLRKGTPHWLFDVVS